MATGRRPTIQRSSRSQFEVLGDEVLACDGDLLLGLEELVGGVESMQRAFDAMQMIIFDAVTRVDNIMFDSIMLDLGSRTC